MSAQIIILFLYSWFLDFRNELDQLVPKTVALMNFYTRGKEVGAIHENGFALPLLKCCGK